jgi:hypothetical protein
LTHCRRRAAALISLAALAACSPPPEPAWHQAQGYRWRELVVPSGTPGFTHMEGRASGITFQNDVSDSLLAGNRMLGQGAGVALGDVDGDARVDVFLAKTQGCSALYRNLGNWKFEDITKSAGVGACDRHSTGAAFVDIDGDGDLDLILVSTTGPNAIFVNDGHGHFTENRALGMDATGKGATTIAAADVDGDGWPDVYVANYKAFSVEDSLPPQLRAMNQLGRLRDPNDPRSYEIVPERQRDYKVVNRPDMGGLRVTTRGSPDDFYLNHGGHLERVPLTASRFTGADGKRLTEEPESFGLGAKLVDLNGDGAPDLYVANDFEDTDQLWFNDGHGGFRLADWTAQRQVSNSAMGVDVADINGDGIPDIFEVDMLSQDTHRLKTQIPTHSPFPKKPGDISMELQQQRNALFLNRGDGTFEEASMAAGVSASGWSWSTMLMDVDLDGRQDILIANGHLWDLMDADVQERLQNRLTDVNWQKQRWQFPPLELKNVAYRNRGDGTFEDVSQKWRWGTEKDISHAMAAADLDGDGDLDVVVNRLRAPALVLRNDAPAPRVAIRLIGDAPNTHAIGARLTLSGGAVPLQEHEVTAGGLYLSHSDYLASFAMGTSDSASLDIRWRDGKRSTLRVAANRMYEITEKTATDAAAVADTSTPAPLFEDATALLHGHTHVEDTFDDWGRQLLLPDALSQLGPGVSWFDVDGDGREDLIVGTGKGGHIALFHNDGARLTLRPASGPPASNDVTTILGMTERGTTRLLAGQSTWEARTIPEMTQPAAALDVPVKGGALGEPRPLVGSHESSTGPLALGDYDGDGDLDLFIGGRAIAMRYPEPGSSGLFRNVNGVFVLDTANSQLLRNIGMVSAAVFADVNGDGKPDLVIAREWNSILLFLNDGAGHFTPASDSWGLSKWTSRWNGIATGDFDGDGRLDLIATSWGRNIVEQADSARPLSLYYGPIGARQEDEMLLARQDPRLGGIAPLNSYARVRVAIPDVVNRLPTFASYADATVDKVLGPTTLANTKRLESVTMDQMLFLNRGDHFEAVPLPPEAQMAPAFYAGVADFNGDGFEDVVLSQNFYPTSIGEPRYDTGRGLLLLGDGKGGLKPVTGAQSGIVVYGDQRGAAYADYDGDGRLDLAISQNGAATRLFHNRGAKPGLRVRLNGPPANPTGVGAQIRVVYGSTMGPVREVEAGSGYWSQNGAVQVFGLSGTPTAVWVRWPGGAVTRVPVPVGSREVVVRSPPGEAGVSAKVLKGMRR